MTISEPATIGLSDAAHGILQRWKEDGQIAEMADGYRLGIAVALARRMSPTEITGQKKTVYNVATIDPHQEVAAAIRELAQLEGGSVYRMAERLADAGVRALSSELGGADLDVLSLLSERGNAKE